MQLVITKELSKERNYWLQNLRKDLKSGGEIKNLMEHYEDKKFLPRYQAVMDVILRANWEAVEEERTMCEALRELFADDIRESERNGILLAVGIYKTISRFPEKTNQELAE